MSQLVRIYCRDGHNNGFIGQYTVSQFCPECGKPTIHACPSCQAPFAISIAGEPRPSYCRGCGKPFPWTEAALSAAREYTDELEELTADEKTSLKETFNDLVVATPRTEVAAVRFKRILKKVSSRAGEVLTKMIVDITSDTIAKHLRQ